MTKMLRTLRHQLLHGGLQQFIFYNRTIWLFQRTTKNSLSRSSEIRTIDVNG